MEATRGAPADVPSGRGTLWVLARIAPFLGISFIAAGVGGLFSPGEWYAGLEKPPYNPPDWIFAPVWTALYVCIGLAAGLFWQRSRAGLPMGMWCVQLVLNATWSWLFFGLHEPGWALMEIGVLWLSIAWTLVLFWRVRPIAGALLLPYLVWVGFASFLNYELWRLNA